MQICYDLIIILIGFKLESFGKLEVSISNHKFKSFSDHLPRKILPIANCVMDSSMMTYKIPYYFYGIIFVSLIHFLQSQQQMKNAIYYERYIAKILLDFNSYHIDTMKLWIVLEFRVMKTNFLISMKNHCGKTQFYKMQ